MRLNNSILNLKWNKNFKDQNLCPGVSGRFFKNVKKWNKVEKKSSNFPFGLLGAKSYVKYEPLGTVGMISPWNFPVNLAFVPLVSIFAAGNQVMHKPSEHTPNTSELIKNLCDAAFDQNEIATFLGGPDVGEAFTQLKFDHLLYTGGGSVAKHVMNAASKNLVPCTLELGGKSPVVIGKSADLKTSAKRIMFGKTLPAKRGKQALIAGASNPNKMVAILLHI